MKKFIKTRSCDKIVRLHFHFVKPYNSQTKRNGAFRSVVLGSCLLRKGAGTLHQIYVFVGEGVNRWSYECGYVSSRILDTLASHLTSLVSFIFDHLIRRFLNSWRE